MKTVISGVVIECVQGDIAAQAGFDAVVNAANAHLIQGSGVSGALHRAAGPGLEKESKPLGPINPGEAVLTSGHNLPNKYVIHCVGPVYGTDNPSDQILARCYQQAIELAEEAGITSVAFPAISTGIYRYPVREAAKVALSTIVKLASSLKTVNHVRFVLHDQSSLRIHEEVLSGLGHGIFE